MNDPVPSRSLRGFEHVSVPLLTWWNRNRVAKGLVGLFVRQVSHRWIQALVRPRLVETGAHHLAALDGRRGVLLVGNHRSFFDMYVATSVLHQHTGLAGRLFFPVRSRFFYDHPLGLVVNVAVSGGGMWPPMFHDFGRQRLNQEGLEHCADVLASPGTIVGIHPEGTRNKGPDPYSLLKARGGVGRVIGAADPEVQVLPFFLTGITNDLVAEARRSMAKPGHRGPAIQLAWGSPLRVGEMDRSRPPVVIARQLLTEVAALAEQVRAAAPPTP